MITANDQLMRVVQLYHLLPHCRSYPILQRPRRIDWCPAGYFYLHVSNSRAIESEADR
jgi:hypothetical protein